MLAGTLASCGDDSKATQSGGGTNQPSSGSNPNDNAIILSEEEQKDITNRIAALNDEAPNGFDGAEFNIAGVNDAAFFPKDEDFTGDTENDAILNRNQSVERDFKVKIVAVKAADPNELTDRVIQDVSGGVNTYHLVNGGVVSNGQDLFNNAVITPADIYPEIDLDSRWWQQSLEEYYAIGNSVFFLSGDISPSYFNTPSCVLFSKKLMQDYGITEDPYELVKSGEWTVDKMFEMASAITGDGDVYRYGDHSYNAGISLYFGSGHTLTTFDENHLPKFVDTFPDDAMSLAVKVSAETGNKAFSYNMSFDTLKDGSKPDNDECAEEFAQDKILFYFDGAGGIFDMRKLETSGFGILPVPKATAEQKNYITYSISGFSAVFLPKNDADAKMMGVITEAMGAYGYQYIRPAYYDMGLRSKGTYDMESKDMLDIIYSTQVYDLYDLYGGGSYETGNGEAFKYVNEAIWTDPSNITSSYKTVSLLTSRRVSQLIKTYETFQ